MKLNFQIQIREIFNYFLEMKVSVQIILLLFVLFSSVLVGGYFIIDQLKTFKNDAFLINNLGIIRGSIQRITKNELNNNNSNNLITELDLVIHHVKFQYPADFVSTLPIKQKNLNEMIQQLEDEWITLKKLYFKQGEDQADTSTIFQQSELCWDIANRTVYVAQELSEQKLENYKEKILSILFAVSILILGIILLVYKIVHMNLEVNVITDPMTKLYNRNFFNKVLLKQELLSKRYNSYFSLILCDVDYFKKVNDDFGHPGGDKVLILLSQLLNDNARKVDYVFRLGGEEFAIIVPQSNLEQSTTMAEKYRILVSETDFNLGRALTVSIGVSQFSLDDTSESLFMRADMALYEAKSTGRNRVITSNKNII